MEKYRVVFHLEDDDKQRADDVLTNIDGILSDLGQDNVEVELLANSEGVKAMTKTANWYPDQVRELAAKGVRFAACGYAMKLNHVQPDELLPQVKQVPSGAAELVRKQSEGWAYIRP